MSIKSKTARRLRLRDDDKTIITFEYDATNVIEPLSVSIYTPKSSLGTEVVLGDEDVKVLREWLQDREAQRENFRKRERERK